MKNVLGLTTRVPKKPEDLQAFFMASLLHV